MLAIGIDPGLSGAIAAVDRNGLQGLQDIPIMLRGGGGGFVKHQINAAGLADILRAFTTGQDKVAVMVFIELVNAMAGQGRSSIASLGMTAGIIEGVVVTLGLPHKYVTPQTWKKHYGIQKDKEIARATAVRFYPEADLSRKKDHNRAESILIARYGHEVTA